MQTVSRAINNKGEISEDTRRRVLETSQRLGYRPSMLARGLVTRQTLTLGLVVPDIANPFFSEIARGAEDAAHAAGYSLLLGNSIENPAREADVLRTLEEKCVDGIVLCSSRLSQAELAELMDRLPSLVLINRPAPNNKRRCCQCGRCGRCRRRDAASPARRTARRRVPGRTAGIAQRAGACARLRPCPGRSRHPI